MMVVVLAAAIYWIFPISLDYHEDENVNIQYNAHPKLDQLLLKKILKKKKGGR